MTNTAFKRILYERGKAFAALDKRGQSKHVEKIRLKESARSSGLPCPKISGLFSDGTIQTYLKQTDDFLNFIDSTGADVKHIEDCFFFVRMYFDFMTKKELSAWTIHTRMFALAAMFGCKVSDFGIKLPARRRKDIKRTRLEMPTSERFTDEKYDNIRAFVTGTGARREGLRKLKKGDLIVKLGGDMLIHLDEKGGKERWALVLPEYAGFVKSTFDNSPGYGPRSDYLFPKSYVPDSMTIHLLPCSLRAKALHAV